MPRWITACPFYRSRVGRGRGASVREAVEGISAPVRQPSRLLLPEAERVVCGALPVVREIEIVPTGGPAARSIRPAGHDGVAEDGDMNRTRVMKIEYSTYEHPVIEAKLLNREPTHYVCSVCHTVFSNTEHPRRIPVRE
jgi:hypothetical protein